MEICAINIICMACVHINHLNQNVHVNVSSFRPRYYRHFFCLTRQRKTTQFQIQDSFFFSSSYLVQKIKNSTSECDSINPQREIIFIHNLHVYYWIKNDNSADITLIITVYTQVTTLRQCKHFLLSVNYLLPFMVINLVTYLYGVSTSHKNVQKQVASSCQFNHHARLLHRDILRTGI